MKCLLLLFTIGVDYKAKEVKIENELVKLQVLF